jgi:hypothetical protein
LYGSGQTRIAAIRQNLKMVTPKCSPIERAHKLRDGILVYFDDGKIAFFSASLLRSILPYGIEFRNAPDEETRQANVARMDNHTSDS